MHFLVLVLVEQAVEWLISLLRGYKLNTAPLLKLEIFLFGLLRRETRRESDHLAIEL